MVKNDTATLAMVSTALFVLDEYKCHDLVKLAAEKGIQTVKKEVDDLLKERLLYGVQSN